MPKEIDAIQFPSHFNEFDFIKLFFIVALPLVTVNILIFNYIYKKFKSPYFTIKIAKLNVLLTTLLFSCYFIFILDSPIKVDSLNIFVGFSFVIIFLLLLSPHFHFMSKANKEIKSNQNYYDK